MKSYRLRFTIILTFLFSAVFAQAPKEFPADDAAFVKALGDYVASNNRAEAKLLGANFQKSYLFATTTADQIATAKHIAGVLLQKKAPLYPNFYNYTQLLLTTTTTQHPSNLVKQHLENLDKIISSDSKEAINQFNIYLAYLQSLFTGTALYQDKAKKWETEGVYTLAMEGMNPVMKYTNINLVGTTTNDTVIIKDASGQFYPITNEWLGTKGTITWRRAGLDESKVYATFGKHSFNLDKSDLKLDSVTFSFLPYVDGKMTGSFYDKLSNSKTVAQAFPQFTSYNIIKLKELSPELKFESGMTLEGKKLFATGINNERAKLEIKNKAGIVMAEADARRFLILDFQTIQADNAGIKFFFIDREKPIFHPSLSFDYSIPKRTIKATRENKAEHKIPVMSSYFNMNFYVDQILWKVDSNYAELNSLSANAEKPSFFESYDYYKEGIENKFRTFVDFDPLGVLKKYCDDYQTMQIPAESAAELMRASSPAIIESFFYKLMEDGYIYYDRDGGMVTVFDKLMLHVDAAAKMADYDNIRFSSNTMGRIGKILFDRKEVEIYGVKQMELSNKKNVIMRPTSDTVYLSENRGITLKGMLTAGKVNFYSNNLKFSYENFEFSMMRIDSMLLMVPTGEKDKYGRTYMMEINTPIQAISGSLFIDEPFNRAGVKSDPKYPYFVCNDSSYIYFDKGKFGKYYPKDSFYYEVFPFQFDSMNTIVTENLKFQGRFVSKNIFKPFNTVMSIQQDLTLGFNITTPEEGLPMYGGKGVFHDSLVLNNSGLRGKGSIDKMSLRAYVSHAYIFPDSIHAVTDSVVIKEDKKFNLPSMNTGAGKIIWFTQKDSLLIRPEDELYSLHQDAMKLKGFSDIYANKLIGNGELTYKNATLQSEKYTFGKDSVDGFLSSFELMNSEGTSRLVKVKNVFTGIQTSTQLGAFKTTDSTGMIALPASQLQAVSGNFQWDLAKDKFTFYNPNINKEEYFECLNASLAGVKITASVADYDLNSKNLSAKGVSQVLVADSKIIPAGNAMELDENGTFKPFENAEVILNADSNFHRIANATVNVSGKDNMSGNGILVYNGGDAERKIKVEEFITKSRQVEKEKGVKAYTKYYISARGEIPEEDKYYVDNKIFYKGNVLFTSEDRGLTLDGYAKMELVKDSLTEWFKIKQGISLERTYFDIDSLKNEFNQPVLSGIALDMNSLELYPMVMRAKNYPNDRMIYQTKGAFKFGPEKGVFTFAQKEILENPKLPGNFMKFNDDNGIYDITGEFDLAKISPAKWVTYGSARYGGYGTPLMVSGTVAFDFFLAPEVNAEFVRFMLDGTAGATGVVTTGNKPMARAFYHLIEDKAAAANTVADMDRMSMLNLPPNFSYNIVLSDVKLKYDTIEGTFKSIDKVSLMVFGYKPMLVKVDCYLEVGPRPGNDFVNMYLQLPNGEWLFLRYVGKDLGIISSDTRINDYIAGLKIDRKMLKQGKEKIYEYMPATVSLKDNFISRMMDYKDRNP